MHTTIPRSSKMIKRSQTRPIPNIIPIGMSVICIMFKRVLDQHNALSYSSSSDLRLIAEDRT
jgi:hypothetical protein